MNPLEIVNPFTEESYMRTVVIASGAAVVGVLMGAVLVAHAVFNAVDPIIQNQHR